MPVKTFPIKARQPRHAQVITNILVLSDMPILGYAVRVGGWVEDRSSTLLRFYPVIKGDAILCF